LSQNVNDSLRGFVSAGEHFVIGAQPRIGRKQALPRYKLTVFL
jgi:hypothetical protein